MSFLFRTLLCLSVVCSVCSLQAQTRKHAASIGWGASMPLGDNYIDETSFANFSLEWNYRVLPVLSAGVSFGYGASSFAGFATIDVGYGLASGQIEKKLNTIPIMAQFDYFPLGQANSLFRPYLGAGVGVQQAKFQITGDAIVTTKVSTWAESFSARLGTRICPARDGKVFFDARCVWRYGGNSWTESGVSSVQNLGLIIGAGILF